MIQEEELQLENLKIGVFVVVVLKDTRSRKKKFRQYVAKILQIDDDDDDDELKIGVDYLKQVFDHPEQFLVEVSAADRDRGVLLHQIVMVLPQPECRKGKYHFPDRLSLK